MAPVPAAPIRQPRGPNAAGFGRPASPPPSTTSPPVADNESTLRRNNTVGSGQSGRYGGGHATSASLGGAAFGFSGPGGSTGTSKYKESRFRSGSLSSNGSGGAEGQSFGAQGGLSRKPSVKNRGEVSGMQEVIEDQDLESPVGGLEGGWGKGLARQSSLPNRRGYHASITAIPPVPTVLAPPRPPRRISDQAISTKNDSIISPASSHAHTHSLGSLASLNRMTSTDMPPPPLPANLSGVSRTQSLRNQAKHAPSHGLGRSTSLRQAGEHQHHSRSESMYSAHESATLDLSSPPAPSPNHPYTPPSPPPQSSTAALPPFPISIGMTNASHSNDNAGADVKRHQSLGHQYGRLRDRLDRAPALLSLDQRGNAIGPGSIQRPSSRTDAAAPPTSPLYDSVWSPQATPGDDGWDRSIQGVSEALAGINVSAQAPLSGAQLQQQLGMHHTPPRGQTEEPDWVASLVGGKGNSPQPAQRAPSAPAGSAGPGDHYQNGQFAQRWPDGQGYLPLNYLQQQQQQQYLSSLSPGYFPARGMNVPNFPGQMPGYMPPYMTPPPGVAGGMYPNMQLTVMPHTPVSAPTPHLGAQDQAVIELARSKGLNPATFDCQPPRARFFVIKSYTEEDVQKSLKHEIWSSTVLGNKRLNNAFKESSDQGPIYLFFSVNGSRHFCGVAEMLTEVDETQDSKVWTQDKWKGIFKVRWIFVRDVPSTALRHIRLIHTPEQKPITNSRDTQELHYEAGCEVLGIFLDWQNKSKTSLLQDFAYYESLSEARSQNPTPSGTPLPGSGQVHSPNSAIQQQGMIPNQPIPQMPMLQMPVPMQAPGGIPMGMQLPMPMGMGINQNMTMGGQGFRQQGRTPPVPPIPARYR